MAMSIIVFACAATWLILARITKSCDYLGEIGL
jgi:hypothetical protein